MIILLLSKLTHSNFWYFHFDRFGHSVLKDSTNTLELNNEIGQNENTKN